MNLSLVLIMKTGLKRYFGGRNHKPQKEEESLLKQKPSVLCFINYWVKVITQGDIQLKKWTNKTLQNKNK